MLFVPSMKQMWDHLHDPFGWFRDAAPILRLGMAPLNHFLFGTLFESFVQGPEPLRCPGRPLSSQFVVVLSYVLPAPVLVHNHGMLVRVLLQNPDVRLNQAEQVQFFRQSKV